MRTEGGNGLRTHGTVLMGVPNREVTKTKMVTRKFDSEFYKNTGKIRYINAGVESYPTLELQNEQRMKDEIKTIQEFSDIGSYRDISRMYHVQIGVSLGYQRKLLNEERKRKNNGKA